jgi:hypothetical protein
MSPLLTSKLLNYCDIRTHSDHIEIWYIDRLSTCTLRSSANNYNIVSNTQNSLQGHQGAREHMDDDPEPMLLERQ